MRHLFVVDSLDKQMQNEKDKQMQNEKELIRDKFSAYFKRTGVSLSLSLL